MTTVFIAGSRAVSRLNSQITERIDNIVKQGFTVLVGDANGADKAVQSYLAKRQYQNVVVHCMDVCRNNVGGWTTQHHQAPSHIRRDRHYYVIKDKAMASRSTCGFMLWDGRSKGTLANVINLINAHKNVLLYLRAKKSFLKLGCLEDLSAVLRESGVRDVTLFLEGAAVTEKDVPRLLRFG
jgi:hypothetical protein